MSRGRSWQRWVPLAGLGLILTLALVVGTTGHSRGTTIDDRVHRITSQIKCPVCSGETVADSSAPISQDIRTVVRQQLLAGRSDSQITTYIVHQYRARRSTPRPTASGFLCGPSRSRCSSWPRPAWG